MALLILKKPGESIPFFDKVLAQEPNATDALYHKGVALFTMGRYQEAIAVFDKVLEIDPDNADALFSKGYSIHKLNRKNNVNYQDLEASENRETKDKKSIHICCAWNSKLLDGKLTYNIEDIDNLEIRKW